MTKEEMVCKLLGFKGFKDLTALTTTTYSGVEDTLYKVTIILSGGPLVDTTINKEDYDLIKTFIKEQNKK